MNNAQLKERVLAAWVGLNGVLKDSRVTKDMSYNEAIVMRIVLEHYREDLIGLTPVSQIIKETRMLKSLVNRTVNTLCEKGYLEKRKDGQDGRNLFVVPVKEKLPDFLEVHKRSLELVDKIIGIIGEEDAVVFSRLCEKIINSGIEI